MNKLRCRVTQAPGYLHLLISQIFKHRHPFEVCCLRIDALATLIKSYSSHVSVDCEQDGENQEAVLSHVTQGAISKVASDALVRLTFRHCSVDLLKGPNLGLLSSPGLLTSALSRHILIEMSRAFFLDKLSASSIGCTLMRRNASVRADENEDAMLDLSAPSYLFP